MQPANAPPPTPPRVHLPRFLGKYLRVIPETWGIQTPIVSGRNLPTRSRHFNSCNETLDNLSNRSGAKQGYLETKVGKSTENKS